MPVVLKNNAFGFLQSAISNSDTTAVLTTGTGANFPTLSSGEYFYATISPIVGASEIVKVTARSGDLLTIVRAQEGTSALSFPAGSRVELRVTARSVLDAIDDKVATKDQASEIAFTPVGGISSTNVQAALAEVDSEKVAFTQLAANSGAALVGYQPAGTNAVPTTVQAALAEVDSEKVAFTQLAANSGAALVGYQPAGTGAVPSTVQAKLREFVSVKDFGAVGDGVTDDTAAVVAAIAAVGDFGEVYFPGGNYRLTSSIATRPGLTFVGYGATITVPGSVDLFVTTSDGYSGRISFFGFKFISSGLTSRAIYLNNNSGFARVSDCVFEGFDVAVYLDGSYTSLIERCRFTNNKYGTIIIKAVATTHFQSCFYDYNVEAGIAVNGTSGGPLHSNQFLTPNIRIESTALQNSKYGLWAEFVEDLELSSVYFEGNSINDANIGAPVSGSTNRFCRGVNFDGVFFNSTNILNLRLRATSRSKFMNLSFLTNTGTTQPKVSVESGCTDIYVDVMQCDSGAVSSTWPVDASAVPTEVITKILGVEYTPINYVRKKYGAPGNDGMQIRRRTTPSVGRPALSFESVGAQHDLMFKYSDAFRLYNASDVEQFSVSHVAAQVYSVYPVRTVAVAVASLPSASTQGSGARAFVTDANATTFASIVAGGGSNHVPVYSDGTNWRIG